MTSSGLNAPIVWQVREITQAALARGKASAEQAMTAERLNNNHLAIVHWEQAIKDITDGIALAQNPMKWGPILRFGLVVMPATVTVPEDIYCALASYHFNAARVKLAFRRPNEVPGEVTGHLQMALQAIDQAIDQNQNNGEYHRFRAGLLVRMGDLTGCDQALNRALELNPGDMEAHLMRQEMQLEITKIQTFQMIRQMDQASIGMLQSSQRFIDQITGGNPVPSIPYLPYYSQPAYPPMPYPQPSPSGTPNWVDTLGKLFDLAAASMKAFGTS